MAHYETPDPLSFFFARRALEVTTQQIVNQLLPEFSLVHGRGQEGGDESAAALAKNLNPFKRKSDPPAVFWSGIVEAGPDERTVSFDVPESFNGTLRLVAVAATPTAMGVTQASSVIRGPYVVSPNTPTFAAPHDSLVVTAAIANNVEGSGDKASVTVELAPNASFTVKGPSTQTLNIPEGREGVASFEVTATEVLGAGELRFLVSGSKQEVSRTAHLSDPPGLCVHRRVSGRLAARREEGARAHPEDVRSTGDPRAVAVGAAAGGGLGRGGLPRELPAPL